jgi:hypothetical protein
MPEVAEVIACVIGMAYVEAGGRGCTSMLSVRVMVSDCALEMSRANPLEAQGRMRT